MKKVTLLLSLFSLTLIFACGPKSEKGKWTDIDKTAAKTAFMEAVKKADATVAEDVVTKATDCAVAKAEQDFANLKEVDAAKLETIAKECLTSSMPAPAPAPVVADTTAAVDTTKKVEAKKEEKKK
jgi:hypothetical protein